tara:strand:- start:3994 stop:4278 length:285 start_codon:yes stop_codon:yes gene_type:complete
MSIINRDKNKQIIVFVVNIVSPSIYQVSIGKITKPVQEPKNLADQTEPVASDTNFQAYQKVTLVGTPTKMADNKALSAHHEYIFCKFSWYQPKI